MICRDISFIDPLKNLLFDDVLLEFAEQDISGEALRFWESPSFFIVLGLTGKEIDDVQLAKAKSDNIPIYRRSSGGGTVFQGKGCLNYTVILDKRRHAILNDLRQSYQYICGTVIDVLKKQNIQAAFFPISDIALKENKKKISGNAQKRKKNYILHHGTILYDFPLELISRYLLQPKDMPLYREERTHLNFIQNVDIDIEMFKAGVKKMYLIESDENKLSETENKLLDDLMIKYQNSHQVV